MTQHLVGWIAFAVCMVVLVAAVTMYVRAASKRKVREDLEIEYLRGGSQPPHLQRKDIVSCEGCGCLLYKTQQFEQAVTIAKVEWRNFDGSSAWVNTIVEHYLCLRCAVDGNPPAREMKPC
jgi:hypothetical protein